MGRATASVSGRGHGLSGRTTRVLASSSLPKVPRRLAASQTSRGSWRRRWPRAASEVHVWSPAPAEADARRRRAPVAGGYAASRLRGLSRALDAVEGPRRLFVQWVPHGYGYKSLNVPFCRGSGDVHARVTSWTSWSTSHSCRLPQDGFARTLARSSHRLMLMVLLRAAAPGVGLDAGVSADGATFRPQSSPYAWLPIPSPIPSTAHAARRCLTRRRTLAGAHPTVGYFGTANALVAGVLESVIVGIAGRRPDVRFVLLGRGTETAGQRARGAHTRPRPGDRRARHAAGRRTLDHDSVLRSVRAAVS